MAEEKKSITSMLDEKRQFPPIPEFVEKAHVKSLDEYMAMRKPVIATRLPGVMKEFGVDNGVIYVDRPEDVVGNAIELVRNGALNDLGGKARRFVERNSWDNITDEFESILHNVIREKQNGHSS